MQTSNSAICSNTNKLSPQCSQAQINSTFRDSIPLHHGLANDRAVVAHVEHGVVLDSSHSMQKRHDSMHNCLKSASIISTAEDIDKKEQIGQYEIILKEDYVHDRCDFEERGLDALNE